MATVSKSKVDLTREELMLLSEVMFPGGLRSEANQALYKRMHLSNDPLVEGLKKKIVDALNATSTLAGESSANPQS